MIRNAAKIIRSSRSVLVITGAGLSADSGMPTYRGVSGLYNRDTYVTLQRNSRHRYCTYLIQYKLRNDGMSIEDALSGSTFTRDPALCWKYIRELELACSRASPNRGHHILAEWETKFERFLVLTQNIDGFHKIAGSRNLIEIHGDVRSLECTNCSWQCDNSEAEHLKNTLPPLCPKCGTYDLTKFSMNSVNTL